MGLLLNNGTYVTTYRVPMFSFCSRHKNNVSTIGHVTCRIICFHGIAYLDINQAARKAGVVRPDVLLPTPNRNQSGVQFVLRLIFPSIPAILLASSNNHTNY